jgi:hypothetical protein
MYKVKLTDKDRKDMHDTLMESSNVYNKLMTSGISKRKLLKELKIGFSRIYELFRYPQEYMTIGQVISISKMLDVEVKDVLLDIAPEYNKSWHQIKHWEQHELEKKFEKNQ